MSSGPKDADGREITPERILDSYLNTNDYDDALNGWVSWEHDRLTFTPDTGGDGIPIDGGEPVYWALELNSGQEAAPVDGAS